MDRSLCSGYVLTKHKLCYPLDSDLPGGYSYPPFKQLGPGFHLSVLFSSEALKTVAVSTISLRSGQSDGQLQVLEACMNQSIFLPGLLAHACLPDHLLQRIKYNRQPLQLTL